MDILIKAAQLILSLSILVVLHELGHFIPAKLFKTKVEKFYLFFDYKFSLFKKKIGDTEYGIGWIPLGGYVKIAGMIDESMDKEQLNKPAEDWEFRSKPAWQRLIVMLGGVFVNIVLAILIYSMILFTWGDVYLSNANVKDGIWVTDSLGNEMGLQTGDKITKVGNKDVTNIRFSSLREEILLASGDQNSITFIRNGETKQGHVPIDLVEKLQENKKLNLPFPIRYRQPFFIGSLQDSTLKAKKELQPKDWIVSIGGEKITYFDEAKAILNKNKGTTQTLIIKRKGKDKQWKEHSYNVDVSKDGLMGIGLGNLPFKALNKLGIYNYEVQEYGFFESFPAGVDKAMGTLSGYIRQFKLIFNVDTGAYKSVGGFLSIGDLFPGEWIWLAFWEITAILSVILAFMNILPIPALDGGHALFLFYEIIFRRKPSDKFLEYAQLVGMAILLSLMLFANGNDIITRIFG